MNWKTLIATALLGALASCSNITPAQQAALAQAEALALAAAEQYLAQHGAAKSISTPSVQTSINTATAVIVKKVPSVPPPVVKDIVVAKHAAVVVK